jgi:hypothetical protein
MCGTTSSVNDTKPCSGDCRNCSRKAALSDLQEQAALFLQTRRVKERNATDSDFLLISKNT